MVTLFFLAFGLPVMLLGSFPGCGPWPTLHLPQSSQESPIQQGEGVGVTVPSVILHLHTSLWDSQSMLGSVVGIGSTIRTNVEFVNKVRSLLGFPCVV